ncbi:hypothetical protein L596_010367 [Steinernema carpocapsae]|uniref:Uncharacterized protein n=1 Tax=Steinernema carpocapsae TaxID=34508 RepID=A0A4U5PIL2_STECR|nr:hypothetical protein L596_010367 [Steinernema carpocapsae]
MWFYLRNSSLEPRGHVQICARSIKSGYIQEKTAFETIRKDVIRFIKHRNKLHIVSAVRIRIHHSFVAVHFANEVPIQLTVSVGLNIACVLRNPRHALQLVSVGTQNNGVS